MPYIKRLIGKPGDNIRIINKRLYLNGIALERDFIDSEEYSFDRRVIYQSTGEIKINKINAIGDLYSEKIGNDILSIYYPT